MTDTPPNYWMTETSGVLAEVVTKYLNAEELDAADLGVMRAYLRQWIDSPVWDENPYLERDTEQTLKWLRQSIDSIQTQKALDRWIEEATSFGIDPL